VRAALLREHAHEPELCPDALDEVVEVEVELARDDHGVWCACEPVHEFERDGVDLVVNVCSALSGRDGDGRERRGQRHGIYLRVPMSTSMNSSIVICKSLDERRWEGKPDSARLPGS
jgi:hypothetical protein